MTEHELTQDQSSALSNLLHAAMAHGAAVTERDHELTLRLMRDRKEDFLGLFLVRNPVEAPRSLAAALNLPGALLRADPVEKPRRSFVSELQKRTGDRALNAAGDDAS